MYLTISQENDPAQYHPEWHAPDNVLMQGLRSVYNHAPVNARLYLEHWLGRTSPITEKDFLPEDLQAIKQQDAESMRRSAEAYAMLRSKQDALTPGNALQMDEIGGLAGGETPDQAYRRLKESYARQALAYESRAGRNPVDRYRAASHIDEQGWGNVLNGLADPNERIGTSLGRYNVLATPQGRMAYDQYDFNRYGSEKDEPFSWDYVLHPVKGLDWAARQYNRRPPMPVQIMLPRGE